MHVHNHMEYVCFSSKLTQLQLHGPNSQSPYGCWLGGLGRNWEAIYKTFYIKSTDAHVGGTWGRVGKKTIECIFYLFYEWMSLTYL